MFGKVPGRIIIRIKVIVRITTSDDMYRINLILNTKFAVIKIMLAGTKDFALVIIIIFPCTGKTGFGYQQKS
jgi:hypothetical protein